jgi:multiple sugar transport system permease protein
MTTRAPGDRTFWLAAPLLAATVLLVLGPTIVTVALAFTQYDALSAPRLAGLSNFRALWDDLLFWTAVKNSFYVALASVPLRLTIALGLALLFNRPRAFAGTARVAAYLPSVIPDIAYALVWLWVLNPIYGPLGLALTGLGFGHLDLLLTPWGARSAIVLMGLFQIGEVYVVLLAARRELPAELYELCELEGTSSFWTFRKLTLPLLVPTIMFLGARDIAWSFQSTFTPALVVTRGGPNFATLFLPLYIYQNGFEYLRFGYASAMTIAMFVLTALMVGAQIATLQLWRSHARIRLG